MKSAAARAAPAVDTDLIGKQLDVELAGMADDTRNAARYEEKAAQSRASAAARRLRIGALLLKARGAWPERGPRAKGWGEFLRARGISEDNALNWMAEARGDLPKIGKSGGREAELLAELRKLEPDARARIAREIAPANVSGNSGDKDRGTFCTSKAWADAVGPWDLDPFSNPRSHIVAEYRCMLEDGGDGLLDREEPGSWRTGTPGEYGAPINSVADANTRVWIQPPYSILDAVIAHYGHTRFCALLRLDSSTDWFAALWERTQVIALAKGTREFFEAPPGVEVSTNPQPHALYYADPRDVTPAIYEACIVLTRYQAAAQPALQIVR